MKKLILLCFLGGVCLLGSKLKAQSGVAESPTGADFLHRSVPHVSPEQGDSHRGGETRPDTLPDFNENSPATTDDIVLYLELPYADGPDTLWLSYWHHLIKDHPEITPGNKVPLIAETGNFFEGSDGYKAYRWHMRDSDYPIFFSIKAGNTELITHWAAFPGDQARIRFDLGIGQLLIGGPSSEFFRAQAEIRRLKAEQSFNSFPLMVSRHPERVLSDSSTKAKYELAAQRPAPVSVTMQFVVPGENEAEVILPLLKHPLQENPIIQQLPGLLEGMPEGKAEFLSQRAWSATVSLLLPKLNLAGETLRQAPYTDTFQKWLNSIPSRFDSLVSDPLWAQTRYEMLMLQGRVQDKRFFELTSELPQYLQDQLVGRYVLENYRYLDEGQEQVFRSAEMAVKTPWIAELLGELAKKELKGRSIDAAPLTDLDGNAFFLDSLKGKALVMTFWISGCKFCMKYYERTLKDVFLEFKDREDLIFVSVNADADTSRWRKSISSDRFTHPEMLQLHQDAGTGILEEYKIVSFPQKLLIDPQHNLFLLTKNQYSPEELIRMIERASGNRLSYVTPKLTTQ